MSPRLARCTEIDSDSLHRIGADCLYWIDTDTLDWISDSLYRVSLRQLLSTEKTGILNARQAPAGGESIKLRKKGAGHA
jgi:hypothetical protein